MLKITLELRVTYNACVVFEKKCGKLWKPNVSNTLFWMRAHAPWGPGGLVRRWPYSLAFLFLM